MNVHAVAVIGLLWAGVGLLAAILISSLSYRPDDLED